MPKNVFYAQSGGVTAVINASALGVIEAAREYPGQLGKVYAGQFGILGALEENLIDISQIDSGTLSTLLHTPGGAFGSCRYKLKSLEKNHREYHRLMEVFAAHDIGYFLYNGGGDSQDTAYKVSQLAEQLNYPITCIGIPKTIDNDLMHTDTCPGFGSTAKYVAISILEAGLDIASMSRSSTQVFILEVMGRHAGWIAAAAGLASQAENQAPHLILFPEIPLQEELFLNRVEHCVQQYGYCAIVASEGIKTAQGEFLSHSHTTDAFGHAQLGGVAPALVQLIQKTHGFKCHYAIADYLQRAARHIASQTDVDQAYALGKAAIEAIIAGKQNQMMTIERISQTPYQWKIGEVSLAQVANVERKMPREYIRQDGYHITEEARRYLLPLIQGEAYPPYTVGLPIYARLSPLLVPKKLPKFQLIEK